MSNPINPAAVERVDLLNKVSRLTADNTQLLAENEMLHIHLDALAARVQSLEDWREGYTTV